MKTAESTRPDQQSVSKASKQFFPDKKGEQSFFSSQEQQSPEKSFFSNANVQTKLSIGKPNDPYEKEADEMADQVVNSKQPFFSPSPTGNNIQNKCAACEKEAKEEEKENVQAKPLIDTISPLVQRQEEEEMQAKLEVQRQEEEEEESLQAKYEVQRQEEMEEEEMQAKLEVQRQEEEEEESLQAKYEVQRQEEMEEEEIQAKLEVQRQEEEEEESLQARYEVQRQEEMEEEEMQAKLEVQRQEEEEVQTKTQIQTKSEAPAATTSLEAKIRQTKGKGRSMDKGTRQQMEQSFGADFSNVRIHNNTDSREMTSEIQAQAFTHGNDIYFNTGKYDTGSVNGQHLLAHELTHTIQQGAVTSRKPDIQLEEANAEELAKELAASEQEQVDAVDPTIAEETRQEAVEEAAIAENQAAEDTAASEPETPQEPVKEQKEPAAPTAPVNTKPADTVSSEIFTKEKPLGPAGKQLAEESANACQEAANKTQQLADNQQAHEDASTKTEQAEAAVNPPTEENQSRNNADQVSTVEQAETPQADKEAIRREMNEAVEDSVPSSVEDMNEFESEKKGQVIGNKVLTETSEQVGEVKGTYNEIENTSEAEPAEPGEPLPAIEQAPPTPTLNLGDGAVPELAEEQTDLSEYEEEAEEIYKKEGVEDPKLRAAMDEVDSGPIGEANKERKTLNEKVASEPAKIQSFAQQNKQKVEQDMQQEEDQARREMEQKRKKELEGAQTKQQETKSEMELKREKVTNWINNRYEQAKTLVEEKLKKLEEQAMKSFDEGQKKFSVQFERNVKRRVNAWKKERYSGIFGGVKWLKDKLVGIDHFPEIKNIFKTEREAYVQKIDALIVDINETNNQAIQECKEEITKAKTEIQEYVDQLGPDLRDVGQKALEETKQKLEALDKKVEEEKKKLQDKLCKKREEAIQAIDDKIEEMKSEMGGLVSKLGNLLLEMAKKFFMWALEKIGADPNKLMSIINKGATVLKAIFTDPIGFFKNLGRAVGQGINSFVSNIVEHLKKGLISWLMGAMGDSGLVLPEKFNLKGILSLGLQVAGLTWNMIRTRLVKKLGAQGEKMVSFAESAIDIIKTLIKKGPIALWHMIVDKAAEIKDQVMEGIRNWAITQIIKKATVKLLSMLNPAGAIVQAIIMLYDVVMFFIENWQRIVDFVSSIFSSIGNIARGAVGQAAAFIEKALGQTVPIIISFLARFLGLSGIGKTIRNIIKKIQKPFKKILNKIVGFLVKQVRKIFGKGGKKKVGKDKDARTDKQKKKDVEKGVEQAADAMKKNQDDRKKAESEIKKIKSTLKLKVLKVVTDKVDKDSQTVHIEGEVNPKAKSAPIVLKTGREVANKTNKEDALKQMVSITVSQVGDGIDQNTLDDYKTGKHGRKDNYKAYIKPRRFNHSDVSLRTMDWPLPYLQRRWRSKQGKSSEEDSIKLVFPSGKKSNKLFADVQYTKSDGTIGRKNVIPDYIEGSELGDVKNVNYQSFDDQLRAIEQVARDERKSFSVIVRKAGHPKSPSGTSISANLSANATIHKVIPD